MLHAPSDQRRHRRICLVLISLFISALILSLFSQWDHSQRQQPFHMLPRSLYLITFLQIFFPHDVPLMNKRVFFSTLVPALSSSQLLCWFAIFFFFFFPFPGSPFRDEITLAILQLQENNRLEILKRRWWEGGQCPKEEDHRAKGQPTAAAVSLFASPDSSP